MGAQPRLFLGPIFVCTATATGAAATRLALAADGHAARASDARARSATLETGAMAAELALSAVNDRRLGTPRRALEDGRPGRLLKAARALTAAGLAVRLAPRPGAPAAADHLPSAVFLAAALAYRLGWVAAGRPSALDHEVVAQLARRPQASARPA